jgi:hypothetical protein
VRRTLLVLAALAAVACPEPGSRQPAPPGARPRATAAGNRLNILLVTIDTLRADHLGVYGYRRATSPSIDALARRGVVFDQAYTYWPKTRGSFVALLTGRLAAQSGYGKTHPLLIDFNPTLASVLQEAGYDTVGVVDNPNVAASLGYAKGFARYRETWEEQALASEMDRTRAITADAVAYLRAATPERRSCCGSTRQPARSLRAARAHRPGLHGRRRGPRAGARAGGRLPRRRPAPVGAVGSQARMVRGAVRRRDRDGRRRSRPGAPGARRVCRAGPHAGAAELRPRREPWGARLLRRPRREPVRPVGAGSTAARGPGSGRPRSPVLATTLDFVPTLLDALKVSYPPDLAGVSLLGAARGEPVAGRARLPGQNDRNLLATWGTRFKVVATPSESGTRYALFDRAKDPGETRDASGTLEHAMREERRELELFRERIDAQLVRTRRLLEGRSGEERLSAVACENLKAMGYVQQGCE